jgi:hypothetical protein
MYVLNPDVLFISYQSDLLWVKEDQPSLSDVP